MVCLCRQLQEKVSRLHVCAFSVLDCDQQKQQTLHCHVAHHEHNAKLSSELNKVNYQL